MQTIPSRKRSAPHPLHEEAVRLIMRLLAINSGSKNKQGVDAVIALITETLAGLDLMIERFPHDTYGDLLYVRSKTFDAMRPRILLSGHLDTVFEPESGFDKVYEDETFIYGPGALDMKGGVGLLLMTLRQLASEGSLCNIGAVFSPDEELGSRAHRERLRTIYGEYDYGLAFEGVDHDWALCNRRRGCADIVITTSGRAGHSGYLGNETEAPMRVNAIEGMVRCITAVLAMADPDRGLTINVGRVHGGTKANVVAERAEALFGVRYFDPASYRRLVDRVAEICAATGATYQATELLPPMEVTDRTCEMMEHIVAAGKSVGRVVTFESRGSGADASLMTACGIGTIDGFGVMGHDMHHHHERLYKHSIDEQLDLAAAVIRQLQSARKPTL